MKVSSMRSKAILLALLACAVGSAWSVPVTMSQAASAARGVAAYAAAADEGFGTTVESVATHSTENGAKFYTVKMKEGGTAFMSSDTDDSPVIGYVLGDGDYSKIDPRSPLWAILNRGVSRRKAAREAQAKSNAAGATAHAQRANAIWLSLAGDAAKAPVLGASVPASSRVDPLIRSKWNQSGSDGTFSDDTRCYNYYTPVLSNGVHALCGCVATAMAQVMRYWQYPACAEKAERECYVSPHWERTDPLGAGTVEHVGVTNLWTSGTPYDWGVMKDEVAIDEAEAVREAIGKLTSDAGISVCMHYDVDVSVATLMNCSDALKDVFHYGAAAYWSASSEATTYMRNVQNSVLANLDAGFPVLFGISGRDGGHAVVCDGYEINGDRLYVHLNMGWSGAHDNFYLFDPFTVEYSDPPDQSPEFSYFSDLVFNIIPDGDEKTSVISGRIRDKAGKHAGGATVTLYRAGGLTPLTNVTASATGVYAFIVNDGGNVEYDIGAVAADGKTIAKRRGVFSQLTGLTTFDAYVVICGDTPPGQREWDKVYSTQSYAATVGNSWGNDMTLGDPAVVAKTSRAEFRSLDFAAALDAAAKLDRADGEPVDIEILAPVELPSDRWELGFDSCFHASGDPDAKAVTCVGGGTLVVREGCRALFKNVAFKTAGTGLVVETNAVAAFFGKVRLGAIDLAAGGKIEIAGALDTSCSYVVNDRRPDEVQASEPFGFSSVAYGTAAGFANLFVNAKNEEFVGVASDDVSGVPLAWGVAPVPEAAADATLVQNGVRVNYRKLATALQSLTGDADVIVRRSCSLQGPLSVAGRKLTLRAENAGVDIKPAGADPARAPFARVEVGRGGELTVSNLVLRGFSQLRSSEETLSPAFVLVRDGGVFRMREGARLEGVLNGYGTYGAVKAEGGSSVVLEEGSAIVGCTSKKYGGAVYLAANARLDLCGGAISNCTAQTRGGGVYAVAGSSVDVSGPSFVAGNTSQKESDPQPVPDNVNVPGADAVSPLTVVGSAAGARIGVRFANAALNQAGGVVATFAGGLSDAEKAASAEAFSSDVNNDWYEGVVGTVSDDGKKLVWGPTDREPGTVPEGEGTIRLDRAGATLYFDDIASAFGRLTGGVARVTLKADCQMDGEDEKIAVRGDVTLYGAGFSVGRAGNHRFLVQGPGNSLTLTNVTVKGKTKTDGAVVGGSLLRAEDGGLIVLEDGAVVCDVTGSPELRTSAGVLVWNAKLVMRPGALVKDCKNTAENGAGGGVIVDGTNSVFRFEGGEVKGCEASRGGGVQIANSSSLYVSGDARAEGNKGGNVAVSDMSELFLWSEFTGSVGYSEGVKSDTNVFGRVASDSPCFAEDLVESAKNFHRDADPDITGRIVTNGTVALLVWADAVTGSYYVDEDGVEYGLLDPGAPIGVWPPTAVQGLVYDGSELTGVGPSPGCQLSGNTATAAGDYTATATLKPGFVWRDGTDAQKTIPWSIAKADVELPVAVVGLVYDGSEQEGVVLPAGARYTLSGNRATEPGDYTATATLRDSANCRWADGEPGDSRQIPWKISPRPQWEVVTNYPDATPFAFESIRRISETEWKLVITNRAAYCNYRLLWTADLAKGFTETGRWEQAHATGPWTTNVITSGGLLFWRAEGAPGTNVVLKAEE